MAESGKKRTWAMLMMKSRNLGWTAAWLLRRLAMGLDSVRSSRVPSFATGSAIVGGGLPLSLLLLLEWWAAAIDGDGTGELVPDGIRFGSMEEHNTTPVKRNGTGVDFAEWIFTFRLSTNRPL
jgi:hypothetical protein